MNKRLLYKKAYKMLDQLTPLRFDCGSLCGEACCKGDEHTGMHLYPGEEQMYKVSPGFLKINEVSYSEEYGKSMFQAVCSGKCNRSQRPLACRIFPLVPYMAGNTLTIIEDPRGRSLCPLLGSNQRIILDKLFQKKVRDAFRLLLQDEDIKSFVTYISREVEIYERFLGVRQTIK